MKFLEYDICRSYFTCIFSKLGRNVRLTGYRIKLKSFPFYQSYANDNERENSEINLIWFTSVKLKKNQVKEILQVSQNLLALTQVTWLRVQSVILYWRF